MVVLFDLFDILLLRGTPPDVQACGFLLVNGSGSDVLCTYRATGQLGEQPRSQHCDPLR